MREDFRSGVRVRLKETSQHYRQCGGTDGVVRSDDYRPGSSYYPEWVRVAWDNGHRNAYLVTDLIILEPAATPASVIPTTVVCCDQDLSPIEDKELLGECLICGNIYLKDGRILKNVI